MRAVIGLAGRIVAFCGAEVVPASATASARVDRQRPSERSPVLPWINGGGNVTGSAAMNDRAVRKMAAHLGALAASVEYRLARSTHIQQRSTIATPPRNGLPLVTT